MLVLFFAGILRYQVDFQALDPLHNDVLLDDFDLDDYWDGHQYLDYSALSQMDLFFFFFFKFSHLTLITTDAVIIIQQIFASWRSICLKGLMLWVSGQKHKVDDFSLLLQKENKKRFCHNGLHWFIVIVQNFSL